MQLYGGDADARRFNRQVHLCLVLLYRHFGLVFAGRLFGWLFGQDALLATLHHDIHHGAPRVRPGAAGSTRLRTG